MKQFAAVALAAFVGVLAAMLVYYLVVTKPGIESEFARVDKARAAAKEVGAELEKAADESVAHVREGIESQAQEMRGQSLFATALAAGQGARVAVTESYMTMGKWPDSPAEIGWGTPTDYANAGARAVTIEPGGVIRIDLVDAVAPGASIRLVPTAVASSGMVNWRCELQGDAALSRFAPDCKPAPAEPVPALIGEGDASSAPPEAR